MMFVPKTVEKRAKCKNTSLPLLSIDVSFEVKLPIVFAMFSFCFFVVVCGFILRNVCYNLESLKKSLEIIFILLFWHYSKFLLNAMASA